MAITRTSRKFKDISLSFDMHPVTKDVLALTNESAIKRSIRNIIQTVPGEKFFNTNFGSDVKPTLFELVDYGSASLLETRIDVAINSYEPRATNIKVEVDPLPDLNTYEIKVFFDIIGEETPRQQFTYILEATR